MRDITMARSTAVMMRMKKIPDLATLTADPRRRVRGMNEGEMDAWFEGRRTRELKLSDKMEG